MGNLLAFSAKFSRLQHLLLKLASLLLWPPHCLSLTLRPSQTEISSQSSAELELVKYYSEKPIW